MLFIASDRRPDPNWLKQKWNVFLHMPDKPRTRYDFLQAQLASWILNAAFGTWPVFIPQLCSIVLCDGFILSSPGGGKSDVNSARPTFS